MAISAAELPNINIELAFYPTQRGQPVAGGVAFTQEYTLQGPRDGGRLLPGMRLHYGPGNFYYAAQPHSVYQYSPQTRTLTELDTSSLQPELSWPTAITGDDRRGRVVMASFGGEGYLYAYNIGDTTNAPTAGTWSRIASLENKDIDSITWSPVEDIFYAISIAWGGGAPAIYRIRPDGTDAGEIRMPALPVEGPNSAYFNSEIIAISEYLVVFFEPTDYSDNAAKDSLIYLVNTRTSEVQLTYRRPFSEANENRAPLVQFVLPQNGASVPLGTNVRLSARAEDTDGTIVTVQFFHGGTPIGFGQRDSTQPSLFTLQWNASSLGSHGFTTRAVDNRGGATTSAPLTVNVVNPEPQPEPPLTNRFELTFFVPGQNLLQGAVLEKKYNLNGPIGEDSLLPGSRLYRDARGTLYGSPAPSVYSSRGIIRVDGNGRAQPIPTNQNTGIFNAVLTYDRPSDLFYIVSASPNGRLDRFNPATGAWSNLFTFVNRSIDSLLLHTDGGLYAMEASRAGFPSAIYKYDLRGVERDKIALPPFPFSIGRASGYPNPRYSTEVVSVGDQIVLLIEGARLSPTAALRMMESRMYVINPRTKEVRLTYEKNWSYDPRPIAPIVQLILPRSPTLPLGPVRIGVSATSIPSSIARIELYVRGELIGASTPSGSPTNHTAYFDWSPSTVGTYPFTARAIDARGLSTSRPFTMTFVDPRPANPSATRSLPSIFRPGELLAVEIQVYPGTNTLTWALEDRPPAGFAVSAISDEGTFDSATGKVKFGPFNDNAPRTLRYKVQTRENDTNSAYRFSGTLAVNDRALAVSGIQVTEPFVRYRTVSVKQNPANVVVQFTADSAGTIVEFTDSLDGGGWQEIPSAACSLAPDGVLTINDPSPPGTQRFYRVRPGE